MQLSNTQNNRLIIIILGVLSTISPLSIDMYLSAFPQIAANLQTTEARVSLSVSSYFVGLALGQIFYGPLLDRFGRKPPLYAGLIIYFCASVGCIYVESVEGLVILRFIQALGGCAAQVAATVMVRDFFPVSQSAKIFSILMLMLGVSPLLAPTIGSFITIYLGWEAIFAILSVLSVMILFLVLMFLPKGYIPDSSVSLHPLRILKGYKEVFQVKQFRTYALAGAFTFAGLFAYVAGSPVIFLNYFKVTPQMYGLIFAVLTGGFIGSNQINILLHRKYRSQEIFKFSVCFSLVLSVLLVLSAVFFQDNMPLTLVLLFIFLFNVGLVSPNGSALALAPFSKNVGSAAAMLGLLQMGVGAVVSSFVGLLSAEGSRTVFIVFLITTAVAVIILFLGRDVLKVDLLHEETESTPVNLH